MHLNYVLISDGSSDEALLPILENAMKLNSKFKSFQGRRADFSRYNKPVKKLEDKIDCAVDLYDPDVLFIHRDAENQPIDHRSNEIEIALSKSKILKSSRLTYVTVIPVRMTEAWLLIDVNAIKCASGNPNSEFLCILPPPWKLENEPDPKLLLEKLIKDSSCLNKRRLKKLNIRHAIQLVPRYINDFSSLKELPSYKFLIKQIVEKLN